MKTKKSIELTYERVNELISYNKKTGKFFWALRDKSKTNEIKLKHDFITGHPQLFIDGRYYHAKDIAYLLTFKMFPLEEIKVRDKNKYNLRWTNFIQIMKKDIK